ncbi:MAG: hypothetical protein IKO72_12360 [Kiritimatiellae bacterium]|nr:hypothetical protein [Kiritimatiellia bacterium]
MNTTTPQPPTGEIDGSGIYRTPQAAIDAVLCNPPLSDAPGGGRPVATEDDASHALTIGGIPARYVKAPGRYHAFACDSLHLYEIGATRKDAATMTSFRIDGNIVAIATGMNFEMMRRGMTAMANAILAYKAKSHRQSKELRKRKRAARKAEKMAAEEGGAK